MDVAITAASSIPLPTVVVPPVHPIAISIATAEDPQDVEIQDVIPLPTFPEEAASRHRPRGRPPAAAIGRGRGRAHAAPTTSPSPHEPRSPVPITPPQDSRERHGYLEAIRQLTLENMTAMHKLGANLLTGLTSVDAVDFISAGSTLDPQRLSALRTI